MKTIVITMFFIMVSVIITGCGAEPVLADDGTSLILGVTSEELEQIVATPTPYSSPALVTTAISETCKNVGETYANYLQALNEIDAERNSVIEKASSTCHTLLTSEEADHGWPDNADRFCNGVPCSNAWLFAKTLRDNIGFGPGLADFEEGQLVGLLAQNIADGKP